jgi:transposase
MGTARVHEGIRQMRFEGLLERQTRGEITQEEAAGVLGVSVRTFQRWAERYEEDGAEGLKDGRLNRPSPRRAPRTELDRMLDLYRDKYADFTVKHFHEQLVKRHNYFLGYTVTKLALHAANLVRPAKKRSAHRKKRPRRPVRGMMLHQDGSRYAWLEGQPQLDLIVTMDDATSEILSMFLVEEEGTASTFRALREVVSEHGLFCELYTDRGGHYVYTPEPGVASKTQLTQVGRALKQLGVRQIAARSPEARGRSERLFRTLQDRVPKELRLAGITTVEAANIWLKAYIGEHNARFAVKPEQEGTMFVADRDGSYREVLCVQEERQVGNDNTVSWRGRRLQIPESPLRRHFVKATVRVHEYPDRAVSVFWGPHRLARFTADGTPIVVAPTTASLASCSGPSRTSPGGRAKSASLTAPARVADDTTRVGTKKRAPGRTKKRPDAQKRVKLRNLARKNAA